MTLHAPYDADAHNDYCALRSHDILNQSDQVLSYHALSQITISVSADLGTNQQGAKGDDDACGTVCWQQLIATHHMTSWQK